MENNYYLLRPLRVCYLSFYNTIIRLYDRKITIILVKVFRLTECASIVLK